MRTACTAPSSTLLSSSPAPTAKLIIKVMIYLPFSVDVGKFGEAGGLGTGDLSGVSWFVQSTVLCWWKFSQQAKRQTSLSFLWSWIVCSRYWSMSIRTDQEQSSSASSKETGMSFLLQAQLFWMLDDVLMWLRPGPFHSACFPDFIQV